MPDFANGELMLIDKPLHWTSFDVVNKIRYALRKKLQTKNIKVGHAGTLDPLATGLLIICTGKKTKEIDTFQGMDKQYTGTIQMGATTPSYDAETEINEVFPLDGINSDILQQNTARFIGNIEQFPPIFSAIKVDGQPLYKAARAGKEPEVKSRPITIHDFKLTNINLPLIDFWVSCSKGTYIRSLAHDFGKSLANGAFLKALRRTQIGDFSVENAMSIEKALEWINA